MSRTSRFTTRRGHSGGVERGVAEGVVAAAVSSRGQGVATSLSRDQSERAVTEERGQCRVCDGADSPRTHWHVFSGCTELSSRSHCRHGCSPDRMEGRRVLPLCGRWRCAVAGAVRALGLILAICSGDGIGITLLLGGGRDAARCCPQVDSKHQRVLFSAHRIGVLGELVCTLHSALATVLACAPQRPSSHKQSRKDCRLGPLKSSRVVRCTVYLHIETRSTY
mmetsp:Transcript_12438/g.28375  ORF Transcript_12438/g.28375 Transcript_12438/m.28375 type:complete len:223 (+) Transcript_12438:646-1314(+)